MTTLLTHAELEAIADAAKACGLATEDKRRLLLLRLPDAVVRAEQARLRAVEVRAEQARLRAVQVKADAVMAQEKAAAEQAAVKAQTAEQHAAWAAAQAVKDEQQRLQAAQAKANAAEVQRQAAVQIVERNAAWAAVQAAKAAVQAAKDEQERLQAAQVKANAAEAQKKAAAGHAARVEQARLEGLQRATAAQTVTEQRALARQRARAARLDRIFAQETQFSFNAQLYRISVRARSILTAPFRMVGCAPQTPRATLRARTPLTAVLADAAAVLVRCASCCSGSIGRAASTAVM